MAFSVPIDPFQGLAESVRTSNVIQTEDAFDVSLSYRTSSGTSNTFHYHVSNYSGRPDSVPEGSWSTWTTCVPAAGSITSVLEPPLSFRYARILRNVSLASFVFEFNKQVYGP